jgi:hypothetical protein
LGAANDVLLEKLGITKVSIGAPIALASIAATKNWLAFMMNAFHMVGCGADVTSLPARGRYSLRLDLDGFGLGDITSLSRQDSHIRPPAATFAFRSRVQRLSSQRKRAKSG